MIPKQEPTLMDVIANCLMDLEGAFAEAQSKQSSSSSPPQAGFSGWTGPLFGGYQYPAKGCKSSDRKNHCPFNQYTTNKTDTTTSAAPSASDHFSATFDVSAFDPSNVSVKVDDEANSVEVHAKEEKTAADGTYESREYRKKVPLPETVLTAQLKCTLDRNGQLQVVAPLKKKKEDDAENKERVIPVQFVNSKKTAQEEEKEKNEEQAKETDATVEDLGTD